MGLGECIIAGIEYYDSKSGPERVKLKKEFGRLDEPNGDKEFWLWLYRNKIQNKMSNTDRFNAIESGLIKLHTNLNRLLSTIVMFCFINLALIVVVIFFLLKLKT